jgi:hypothetical protein
LTVTDDEDAYATDTYLHPAWSSTLATCGLGYSATITSVTLISKDSTLTTALTNLDLTSTSVNPIKYDSATRTFTYTANKDYTGEFLITLYALDLYDSTHNVTSTISLTITNPDAYQSIFFDTDPVPMFQVSASDSKSWSYELPDLDSDRLTELGLEEDDVVEIVTIPANCKAFIQYDSNTRSLSFIKTYVYSKDPTPGIYIVTI